MKNLSWLLLPLIVTAGCVNSHRNGVVYQPVPGAVAPTSPSPATRVYPSNPPTPVISAAPGEIVPANELATAVSLRQMLANDTALAEAARNVDIEVNSGRVILRGSVPTEHDRIELQERISKSPGVGTVDNRLTVDTR